MAPLPMETEQYEPVSNTPEEHRQEQERRRVQDRNFYHRHYTQQVHITPEMIRDTQDVHVQVRSADPDTQITISDCGRIEQRRGYTFDNIWMDDAEEITEREPPCEDLGEFLLMKYNKVKFSGLAENT